MISRVWTEGGARTRSMLTTQYYWHKGMRAQHANGLEPVLDVNQLKFLFHKIY